MFDINATVGYYARQAMLVFLVIAGACFALGYLVAKFI
jgi:hypothetical protein